MKKIILAGISALMAMAGVAAAMDTYLVTDDANFTLQAELIDASADGPVLIADLITPDALIAIQLQPNEPLDMEAQIMRPESWKASPFPMTSLHSAGLMRQADQVDRRVDRITAGMLNRRLRSPCQTG